jgi:hypothetical protein
MDMVAQQAGHGCHVLNRFIKLQSPFLMAFHPARHLPWRPVA